MPLLAEAEAVIVTVPETVAPETGDVSETAGGVELVLFTVIETGVLVALLFDVSDATAVSVCFPLAKVVVFKDCE
jgi:hypothetical protein